MDSDTNTDCEERILKRLAAAGADGLTTTDLKLPGAGTIKGKACRAVLRRLLKDSAVGNLGSPQRPRYVVPEHFKPLELTYDHLESRSRESGVRLLSKSALAKGLKGAGLKKVDEALKLLVAEGVLLRLKWANSTLYLHASTLPAAPSAPRAADKPDPAAIHRAYREAVNAFGYPDVLIHEVYLRLGGELEALKGALLEACRSGRAVASMGDWSLSSPEERAAALYIDGHPHLRIRLMD
ncbi:MAG: hypothetical protein U5S82_23205 [Gammaproteobacteria bacterium]|nr:hypothetical protein [Gammaproteobacteria bacterium]